VTYNTPVVLPVVTANSYGGSQGGYGGSKDGYGGKTTGTHVVETKVEATYTTVVGIQTGTEIAAPSYGGGSSYGGQQQSYGGQQQSYGGQQQGYGGQQQGYSQSAPQGGYDKKY